MIWFRYVLWHINPCGLFNAKYFLYMYIIYMIFSWIVCWYHYFKLHQAHLFTNCRRV